MIVLLAMLERDMQKWKFGNTKVQLTKGTSVGGSPLMVFREEGNDFYFALGISEIKATLRAFDDEGNTATEGGES